ncbi:MAG: CPBP family intramembrane glutamic endopeptidase [Planctomycetota bacterium]|jgi:membrane protease YdiL (CAAX protease family)
MGGTRERRECLVAVAVLLLPLPVVLPLHLAEVPAEGAVAYFTFGVHLVGSLAALRLLGRSPSEIGLRGEGLLKSVACSSLLIGAVLVAGVAGPGLTRADDLSAGRLAERGVYCLLVSGPGQEILFRGLLLFTLLRWRGPRVALLVSAALFGLAHFRGGPAGMALNAGYGIFYGLVALETRCLWGPILVHGIYNFLFGYVLLTEAALL